MHGLVSIERILTALSLNHCTRYSVPWSVLLASRGVVATCSDARAKQIIIMPYLSRFSATTCCRRQRCRRAVGTSVNDTVMSKQEPRGRLDPPERLAWWERAEPNGALHLTPTRGVNPVVVHLRGLVCRCTDGGLAAGTQYTNWSDFLPRSVSPIPRVFRDVLP